jgi:hypothetical protein
MRTALTELLENYVAGRISDRRWQRIMDVLDSGILNGQERLEYVANLNKAIVDPRLYRRS